MFLEFLKCWQGAEGSGKHGEGWLAVGARGGVRLVCEEDGLDGRLHSERPSLSVLAAATASCL